MKSVRIQLVVSVIAAGCLAGAYVVSSNSMANADRQSPSTTPAEYPPVTTVNIKKGDYSARVTGYGSANPQQALSLAAEVSGRIVELSPDLASGKRFQAGAVLLKIDDIEYKEAVASATSALATAEIELLQQQLNRKQAQAEWKRSGLSGEPDSELVLYQPQVQAAKAKVDHASKALDKALSDLQKTLVRAPFNAQVVSRNVELGSYVQKGTELTELYGTDRLEVSVPLSETQWANLPALEDVDSTWQVSLISTDGSARWIGLVDRAERHLDNGSRQRALVIRVEQPLDQPPPLYPGTFVRAEIPGKTLNALWRLPSSAISQNNQIWYVSDAGELRTATAKVRFSNDDAVFVTPFAETDNARIVVQPLGSYLPGMRVARIDRNPDNEALASGQQLANVRNVQEVQQ